jgi:hypothetical protein
MGDKQPAKKGISRVESIIFEPRTFQGLNCFLKITKESTLKSG